MLPHGNRTYLNGLVLTISLEDCEVVRVRFKSEDWRVRVHLSGGERVFAVKGPDVEHRIVRRQIGGQSLPKLQRGFLMVCAL